MKIFGWDLCHSCNYRCPYCGVWKDHPEKDLVLSPEQWGKLWDRVFDSYGRCEIRVSGGEPSVYPEFFELIRLLSKKHTLDICTNLSWDVKRIQAYFKPGRLKISATLHPSFAEVSEFFDKCVYIKEYLSGNRVYYVAYPGQIAAMAELSRKFTESGIDFIPMPLRSEGRMMNNEKEREAISAISPFKRSEVLEYQFNDISPRGKLCNAGKDYAVIRYDGKVDRCSQHYGGSLGNIDDPCFKLSEEPSPCEKEYCPIEWSFIVNK